MKNLTRLVIRLLAIGVLLAPFSAGQATTNEGGGGPLFAMQGVVLEKQTRHINVGDVMLRLSPTVKVRVPGKPNASMADINPGDNVGVKMIQYRGKAYVDTIFYLGAGSVSSN